MPEATSQDPPPRRLSLADIDVEDLSMLMANSGGGYFDPTTGDMNPSFDGEFEDPDGIFAEAGIDGEDWLRIDPVPSRDGYRDMAAFTGAVTHPRAADRLSIALEGSGAFRRFKNEMYRRETLGHHWNSYRNARGQIYALEWLVDNDIVDETEARPELERLADECEKALDEAARWAPGASRDD